LRHAPVVSIVDDDASVRAATDRLVRSLGYVSFAFASAEEFLQSPRLADTCCLIADVQMPGMSGVELQERLLADGRRMPTILVTAFPEEHARTRALAAGALCFLTKPIDAPTLIKYLGAALDPQGEKRCS
jgi:FixJ family two-component response regulator